MYTKVYAQLTLKGGVCLSSADTEFQFELNEILYFDDGYQVQELISISLNPEVTIHSYDSYVSIRGEIELQGEYTHEKSNQREEDTILELEDFQAKRFIEKVVAGESGQMEFTHRFPVDISVPAYRIHKVDDVKIDIINFDYELPTNNQLEITAIATVHGIKAEIDLLQEKRDKQTKNEVSFEFEMKLPEKEPTAEEILVEDTMLRETEEVQLEENEEPAVELREEVQVIEEKNEPEIILEAIEEEQREETEEEEIPKQTEEETVKDVSYLTDMFRDEDEDRFTRMKICIVQEDDTIETIAERFQVSTLQLIKQNKLDEDFDISEGQLLYIPKR